MLEVRYDFGCEFVFVPRTLHDRPTLQREDLGPIFNYLSLDVMRRMLPSQESITVCKEKNFDPLSSLVSIVHTASNEALDAYVLPDNATDLIGELLASETAAAQGARDPLTFYDNVSEQLTEGVHSGLVMPLQVYHYQKNQDEEFLDVSLMGLATQRIAYWQDVAGTMRNKMFQVSLLHLANVDNGSYGRASSDFSHIGTLDEVFDEIAAPAHSLIGPETLTLLPEARKNLKSMRSEFSGGCPVRRATYPVLGSTALRFADIMGIAPEQLQNQGSSAIIAGCEVVARCADALVENTLKELSETTPVK